MAENESSTSLFPLNSNPEQSMVLEESLFLSHISHNDGRSWYTLGNDDLFIYLFIHRDEQSEDWS